MKLFYLVVLLSALALSGCGDKEVVIVDSPADQARRKADYEAQHQATCKSLSAKARKELGFCDDYKE